MTQPSMQRFRDKYTPFRDAKMNTAACRGAGLEMETGLHILRVLRDWDRVRCFN